MDKYCKDCGQPLKEGYKFCEKCGAQIGENVNIGGEELLLILPRTQVRPGLSNFDLYITNKRIIAAKVGTVLNSPTWDYIKTKKDRKKYEGLNLEEILNSNPKNFTWNFNTDLESIKIKKHMTITRITLKLSPALGHKTKFLVFSNKYFEQVRVILWKVAANKITGDIGNRPPEHIPIQQTTQGSPAVYQTSQMPMQQSPGYGPPGQQFIGPLSGKPIAAGILLILCAIFSIIMWTLMTNIEPFINSYPIQGYEYNYQNTAELLSVCSIIGIILSIFPLIGGIVALRRKLWGLALTGSILGIFVIGPFFVSSILALIGLILVVTSKNEFT